MAADGGRSGAVASTFRGPTRPTTSPSLTLGRMVPASWAACGLATHMAQCVLAARLASLYPEARDVVIVGLPGEATILSARSRRAVQAARRWRSSMPMPMVWRPSGFASY